MPSAATLAVTRTVKLIHQARTEWLELPQLANDDQFDLGFLDDDMLGTFDFDSLINSDLSNGLHFDPHFAFGPEEHDG